MTLPALIPSGLKVLSQDDVCTTIEHRYVGNWCAIVKLSVMLAVMAFICWMISSHAITNLSGDKAVPLSGYFADVFAAILVVLLMFGCYCLIWQLMGQTTFQFSPQELKLSYRPPLFRSRCFARADIQAVMQQGRRAESAVDADTLWDLRITCRHTIWPIYLIHQDKKDRCAWLGRVVSDWAGIELTQQVDTYFSDN